MDLSHINIGILHSLIGKNDGVSIVIDQSIEAMNEYMGVPLDNIYLLSALAPSRFNKTENEIFWHKNEENKHILKHYNTEAPEGLDNYIYENALYAKKMVAKFIEDNNIDLMIVHNSCHPTNFIYAVAVGMYFEEIRARRRFLPRYLLWWHDSHFERERFRNPNSVVKKYLNFIPGPYPDGIVFINSEQADLGRRVYNESGKDKQVVKDFFRWKTATVPNTSDVPWDFKQKRREVGSAKALAPDPDNFNAHFFEDIGLTSILEKKNKTLSDCALFLQHTRVVERKRIDHAIDFVFEMEKTFRKKKNPKTAVLIVSGHSGDENDSYLKFLKNHFRQRQKETPDVADEVILIFAEDRVFPEREVIVDKKFYRFRDIPGIIARNGGLGTYFSEVEGFGNNLLEMLSLGLPVAINRYPIYDKDIAPLGFDLPSIREGQFTKAFIDECYALMCDLKKRNESVSHNLQVLEKKLHHGVIAKKLEPLIQNLFRYL